MEVLVLIYDVSVGSICLPYGGFVLEGFLHTKDIFMYERGDFKSSLARHQ